MDRIKKLLAAAAAALILASCGNIGGTDPTKITKRPGAPSSAAETESADSEPAETEALTKAAETQKVTAETSPEEEPDEALLKAQETYGKLTQEQKVGQLFIVSVDALETSFTPEEIQSVTVGVTFVDDEMKDALRDFPVGGIVIYEHNNTGEDGLKTMKSDLRKACSLSPFIAVEKEGSVKYDKADPAKALKVTDISGETDAGKAAVEAIKDGADIIALPYDLNAAYSAVLKAVKDGDISEEELERAVMAVLCFKTENEIIK